MWGDPASSGNRIDVGITQSFSFPTVYVQRAKQSEKVIAGASMTYEQKEREAIREAKLTWINLVALNKQLSLCGHRIKLATDIANNAKIQLARGEIDAIRYHHAQMERVNLNLEKVKLDVERQNLQNKLTHLCGGRFIPVPDTIYPAISAWSLQDLTGMVAGNPSVRYAKNELSIVTLDKQIAVSEWFPKFTAGYYSEAVTGLKYRGVTTGISIPLFQNSHTVKTADLRIKEAYAGLEQIQSRQGSLIASLFNKREKLSAMTLEINQALLPVSDVGLLKKALDAGEINISEFYYECSVFYQAWQNLVTTEQELAVTEVELLFAAGLN